MKYIFNRVNTFSFYCFFTCIQRWPWLIARKRNDSVNRPSPSLYFLDISTDTLFRWESLIHSIPSQLHNQVSQERLGNLSADNWLVFPSILLKRHSGKLSRGSMRILFQCLGSRTKASPGSGTEQLLFHWPASNLTSFSFTEKVLLYLMSLTGSGNMQLCPSYSAFIHVVFCFNKRFLL